MLAIVQVSGGRDRRRVEVVRESQAGVCLREAESRGRRSRTDGQMDRQSHCGWGTVNREAV